VYVDCSACLAIGGKEASEGALTEGFAEGDAVNEGLAEGMKVGM
jgi:hypothetical protein